MESAEISSQEKQLIRMIRRTGKGELRIVVKDRKPVRVEQIRKNIRLSEAAAPPEDGSTV